MACQTPRLGDVWRYLEKLQQCTGRTELTNTNPYQSPEQTQASTAMATRWRIRPRNWLMFVALVTVVGIPCLFIPTIEMFKGTLSLGRAPVFLAYLGILMPEYWGIALPIALAHLLGTIIIASMIDRLIWKWICGDRSVQEVEPQDTNQIAKNCSEVLDRPS
jgi:hypothetical protein